MARQLVMLHGLGETPSVWKPVTRLLTEIEAHAPDVLAHSGRDWALDAVTDQIAAEIEEPVDVVGLSLGAVVGLNLAIRHRHLVQSLFISAPQSRPPRALMSVQRGLMRVLPPRLVCPPGDTKTQLLHILDEIATMNLDPHLPHLDVLTTVACGAKDRANLPAARSIATHIPTAHLLIVPEAGHQWHSAKPSQFAHALQAHLDREA